MAIRRHVLVSLVVVGTAGAARAQPADGAAASAERHPALARTEARVALGLRDDQLTSARLRARAEGAAVSRLGLGGTFFGSGRRLGAAAHLVVERFGLARATPSAAPPGAAMRIGGGPVAALGYAARAALAARTPVWADRVGLEAELGYGVLALPTVRAAAEGAEPGAMLTLTQATVRGHGPALAARITLAAHRRVALEAGADVVPVAFGATHDGIAVRPFRAGVHGGLALGAFAAGGARWSALLAYDGALARARGDGVQLRQLDHHVGVGLRVSWPGEPRPAATPAPAPQARAGRLDVVVRLRAAGGFAGAPVGGVPVTTGDGRRFATDEEGRLRLEAGTTPAGTPLELRLSDPRIEPTREFVTIPTTGASEAEILVEPARAPAGDADATTGEAATPAPATAVISGFVRGAGGQPVPARVEVAEAGVAATADATGAFRFELPPGVYTLSIAAPGFVPQHKTVTAGRGEQRIYNVDLHPEAP